MMQEASIGEDASTAEAPLLSVTKYVATLLVAVNRN